MMMSWIVFPLFVTEAELLLHDYTLQWVSKNLPQEPEFFKDLMPVMCHTFQRKESELQLLVREKFMDKDNFTWDSFQMGGLLQPIGFTVFVSSFNHGSLG